MSRPCQSAGENEVEVDCFCVDQGLVCTHSDGSRRSAACVECGCCSELTCHLAWLALTPGGFLYARSLGGDERPVPWRRGAFFSRSLRAGVVVARYALTAAEHDAEFRGPFAVSMPGGGVRSAVEDSTVNPAAYVNHRCGGDHNVELRWFAENSSYLFLLTCKEVEARTQAFLDYGPQRSEFKCSWCGSDVCRQ